MAEIDELRAQPQDILAEQSVLGAIFIDESKLVFVREYIEPADFFKYANRLIFKAMIDLADRGDAIDATTVRNILDSQGDLQNIGGLSYLVEVVNSVPTSANAEYYAKIVAEKAILRRLISRLTESINQAYDGDRLSEEIIAGAEKALIDVSETANRSGFKNIRDVLNLNFGNLEARSLQTSDITGIATGYSELDKMTTGLHEEELIILAARPAVGKTAFALNIAQNIGTKLDKTVAIFSLEMGAESLVDRMLASEGVINSHSIRTGQLTDEEWQKYTIATANLANASIYIDDTPGIRITEIRSRARKLAQETGNLGLVLIDYLQLNLALLNSISFLDFRASRLHRCSCLYLGRASGSTNTITARLASQQDDHITCRWFFTDNIFLRSRTDNRTNQMRIQVRTLDFDDVDVDLFSSQFVEFCTECINVCSTFTDNHTWLSSVKRNVYFVYCAFNFNS